MSVRTEQQEQRLGRAAKQTGWLSDFAQLIKFRLSFTVVFSSVLAYLITLPVAVTWWPLFVLSVGGMLTTGAANVLNEVLEKDYDRLMKRTQNRPLATGRMKTPDAVLLAGFMALIGISFLALFNPWTAFFGTFALVSYAFVYTPMKRVSPWAVVVGTIPGALPVLIGCAAAQNDITWIGLSLFLIQIVWQLPHFFAISFLGAEDYRRAGYRIVPERPDGTSDFKLLGQASLAATLALVLLNLLPYLLGWISGPALALTTLLALGFVYFAWAFFQHPDRTTALRQMFYSFAYIPLVLIVFWIDQLL